MMQYVGARYVPKMFNQNGSNEWVQGVQYESLTVVTYLNNSYTSVQNVPSNVGNPADNPEYWVNIGLYGEKFDAMNEAIATAVDNANQAAANSERAIASANGASQQVAALKSSVDANTSGVAELKTSVQENEQGITRLNGKVSSLETNYTAVQGDITALQGEVANVKTTQGTQGDSITALTSSLGKTKTEVTALQTKTGEMETQLNNVTTTTSGLTTKVSGLQVDVQEQGTKIEGLEETVGNLRKGFTSLGDINLMLLADECGIAQSGSTSAITSITAAISAAGGTVTSQAKAGAGFTTSTSYLNMAKSLPKKDYNAILIMGLANDAVGATRSEIFNASNTFLTEIWKLYKGIPVYVVNCSRKIKDMYATHLYDIVLSNGIYFNLNGIYALLNKNNLNEEGNPNTSSATDLSRYILNELKGQQNETLYSVSTSKMILLVQTNKAILNIYTTELNDEGNILINNIPWLFPNTNFTFKTTAIILAGEQKYPALLTINNTGINVEAFELIASSDPIKVMNMVFEIPIYLLG